MRLGADFLSACAPLGLDPTSSQISLLEDYGSLLSDRAVPLGMIARADRQRIGERHLLDSLRVAPALAPGGSGYDLGSGAGLPGIPVACVRPDLDIVLVERREKRVAFLEFAVERLGLANVAVRSGEVSGATGRRDFCLARAFAPPLESWTAATRLLTTGGLLVYFAGLGTSRQVAGWTKVPSGMASWRLVGDPLLESEGPLVIMTKE